MINVRSRQGSGGQKVSEDAEGTGVQGAAGDSTSVSQRLRRLRIGSRQGGVDGRAAMAHAAGAAVAGPPAVSGDTSSSMASEFQQEAQCGCSESMDIWRPAASAPACEVGVHVPADAGPADSAPAMRGVAEVSTKSSGHDARQHRTRSLQQSLSLIISAGPHPDAADVAPVVRRSALQQRGVTASDATVAPPAGDPVLAPDRLPARTAYVPCLQPSTVQWRSSAPLSMMRSQSAVHVGAAPQVQAGQRARGLAAAAEGTEMRSTLRRTSGSTSSSKNLHDPVWEAVAPSSSRGDRGSRSWNSQPQERGAVPRSTGQKLTAAALVEGEAEVKASQRHAVIEALMGLVRNAEMSRDP
eukprot:jgi/Ulvmu1/6466/UM003_0097.1